MHGRPLCGCKLTMSVTKIGVSVIVYAYFPPQPYQVWQADLFQCPKCGSIVVANFADQPTQSFDPEFSQVVEKAEANANTQREFESMAALDEWIRLHPDKA